MTARSALPCRSMIAAAAVLAGGCGPKQTAPVLPKAVVVFPAPPDTTRIQFLTRFSGARDLKPANTSGGLKKFLFGEETRDTLMFSIVKPYGVAIHDGRIYLCDTMAPGVDVIDLRLQSFTQRKGAGEIKKPINCAVDDATGHLYVTDTERGQVLHYDETAGFVAALGNAKMKPSDVFVQGDTVWVADLALQQIMVYSKTSGRLLFAFPARDSLKTPGTLFQPVNLYVRDSLVYVSDIGDFKVKVYSREGRFLRAVGGYGTLHGQFQRSKGIAVDRDHNLYVVDAAFENVQIFDRDGNVLMAFGGPYKGPGNMWLPAKVIIDYDNLEYFQQYVDPRFTLKYLILVTNQYGPDKLSVYGRVEPKAAAPTP